MCRAEPKKQVSIVGVTQVLITIDIDLPSSGTHRYSRLLLAGHVSHMSLDMRAIRAFDPFDVR